MPKSRQQKRHEPELVELAPGVSIPTAFVFTSSSVETPTDSWSVRVITDPVERIPRLAQYVRDFGEPPTVAELDDERLRLIVEHAIASRAHDLALERLLDGRDRITFSDDAEHVEFRTEMQRVRDQAVTAVRPKPGRRPVTDEEKLRILDLYRTKGIAETMAATGKQERTVRRYIADARRIEQGAH